jgi:hypothetical protein
MHSVALLLPGAAIASALALAAARPVAFQKSNALAPAARIEPLRGGSHLDLDVRLASIPYQRSEEAVLSVDPRTRYRETILAGRGNCSNLAFGLAYELERFGIDYQIVHLLPSDFLSGRGHTVLRTRYELDGREHTGVVDLLEGGVPTSGGRALDVNDLRRAPIASFAIRSLNERRDTQSPYYGAFLSGAHLGFIPSREVHDYFRFVESLYVPLGSRRTEKMVYDGLAVVAGVYPRIYVPEFAELVAGKRLELGAHVAACWILRFAFLAAPIVFARWLGVTLAAWIEGAAAGFGRRSRRVGAGAGR